MDITCGGGEVRVAPLKSPGQILLMKTEMK